MGRPPKNSNIPNAKERIISAFGKLLERYPINEIGIKAIINAAQCNRATFYYYFDNVYDLFNQYVETELLNGGDVTETVFSFFTTDFTDESYQRLLDGRGKKLVLAMRNGGTAQVRQAVCKSFYALWGEALKCGEAGLTEKTKAMIQYEVTGFLGVFYRIDFEDPRAIHNQFPREFLSEISCVLTRCICKEQGANYDEVVARLAKS